MTIGFRRAKVAPVRDGIQTRIDKGRLIETAFAVLDEQGLGGLSMRAVARRLNVNASALYWHVRNRSALIELMVATIYERAFAEVGGTQDWHGQMRDFAHRLRANILAHPGGAQLCSSVQISDDAPSRATLRMTEPLRRAGWSDKQALQIFSSIIALVLGWSIHEQNGQLRGALVPVLDFDDAFEAGLCAMLSGFAHRRDIRIATR